MTHPAVTLALSTLPDQDLVVRKILERLNVIAVIAENALVSWTVIVEKIENQWETATYVAGYGRQSPNERWSDASSPPMLSQRQTVRSGRPQPNGSPPLASWCVISGFAARDAHNVTVTTNSDSQSCPVSDDGFVAALVYSNWDQAPRVIVKTISGQQCPG